MDDELLDGSDTELTEEEKSMAALLDKLLELSEKAESGDIDDLEAFQAEFAAATAQLEALEAGLSDEERAALEEIEKQEEANLSALNSIDLGSLKP